MMDQLLKMLADQESMEPSGDRLSQIIADVMSATKDDGVLEEEDLDMVQAAAKPQMVEKPETMR